MTPERLDAIRGAAETCQWGRDADAAEMLLDLLAALDEAHARLAHAEADAAQAIHYVSRERDAAVVELSTAYSETLLKLDTATRAKAAWEGLYNERSAQCTIAERKLEQIKSVLDDHGCDCDCDCAEREDDGECDWDCEPCLACRLIYWWEWDGL